jgi:hypothetical protein
LHVLKNLSFLIIFCQVLNRTSNRTKVQAELIRCNKRRTENSTKPRLLVVIIKLLHRFLYLIHNWTVLQTLHGFVNFNSPQSEIVDVLLGLGVGLWGGGDRGSFVMI